MLTPGDRAANPDPLCLGRAGEADEAMVYRPDRLGRSRLNHDVAIVERRSFHRAKSNLVEQEAVLGGARDR